jgi:hypothetical protein
MLKLDITVLERRTETRDSVVAAEILSEGFPKARGF